MDVRLVICLVFLFIASNGCTDRSSCFLKKLFDFNYPEQNVYNISLSADPNSLNNQVLGYGDFNNDLYADYVAVDSQNNLLIFSYQNQGDNKGLYIFNSSISVVKGCNPLNVYLYDINSDGLLDITVWGSYENSTNCLYPLQQNGDGGFDNLVTPLGLPATTQPIIFQIGPNLGAKTTILLLFDSLAQTRQMYYFSINSYIPLPWTTIFGSQNQNTPFSDQHWNSVIDLTDDCSPDIVLTNSQAQVQFWVWSSSNKAYNLAITLDLTAPPIQINPLTMLAFQDLDYDGEQDLILANQSSLFIYKSTLAASSEFCTPGKTTIGINFNSPVVVPAPAGCLIIEQNLQIGDFNIDGYPDLMFLCQKDTLNQIVIYENIFDQSNAGFQSFDVYQKAVDSLITKAQLNVTQVSIFDILENGILDLIITTNQNRTIILYNNYLYQNYFYIKGFATNGEDSGTGAQIPGATFYWLNSLGNSQRIAVYSQMYQTAYGAVPMPYVLTGLGRANNYVEQFTLGRLGLSKSWSPIIPNSQLAVFSGSDTSDNWQIKVFITPTDSIVYVLIVCIVILAILGSVLAVLKCRTKKQQNLLYGDVM